MTIQVPLSIAGDAAAFAARVAAFRQAKLAHHGTTAEPAPREHELVEACIERVPRGEAPDDYAIVALRDRRRPAVAAGTQGRAHSDLDILTTLSLVCAMSATIAHVAAR